MSKLIKTIITIGVTLIFLFSTLAQPQFPESSYDGVEGTLKLNLKKGWNLIPWVGPSYDFPNTCGDAFGPRAIFVWSPTEKSI